MAKVDSTDPSLTYSMEDFVKMKFSDTLTYYNFSILEKLEKTEQLDTNLFEEYLDCIPLVKIRLEDEEFKRYKYRPDLLAYDLYGSTQLDFVILLANDAIDPKDFDRQSILLPRSSDLFNALDQIYSNNYEYIKQNRMANNISM